MKRLSELIASVFYIGYFPVMSGTVASVFALFVYYFLKGNPLLMGIAIFILILLGLLTAGNSGAFNGRDAREIVIDEFAGMLVALYLLPGEWGYVIAGFLLFRFFDIVKPFPIKDLEKLKSSLGIMADDLMAGVYANLILQAVRRIL